MTGKELNIQGMTQRGVNKEMLTWRELNIQEGDLEGTKHRNSMIQIGEVKFWGT